MNFQFSDTWLLHSILNTEKKDTGAEMKDIIAFADYTNHSIMEYEEFAGGIEKLLAAGLILPVGKNYSTSEEFKVWFKSKFNKKIRMNVQKEFTGIENYLNAHFPDGPSNVVSSDFRKQCSEEEFRKVISGYLEPA
ncbi:MAG: hypothetical protein IAF38_02230 [Bacteroidia bacterium]|nr:hypothetical protein [Bacteroidia bacterium]